MCYIEILSEKIMKLRVCVIKKKWRVRKGWKCWRSMKSWAIIKKKRTRGKNRSNRLRLNMYITSFVIKKKKKQGRDTSVGLRWLEEYHHYGGNCVDGCLCCLDSPNFTKPKKLLSCWKRVYLSIPMSLRIKTSPAWRIVTWAEKQDRLLWPTLGLKI